MGFRLFYTDVEVEPTQTPFGYKVVKGIETAYTGRFLRGKVVLRFDLLYLLTDVFSKEILDQYRNVIYSFIAGNLNDAEKISLVLQTLYENDNTFRLYLGELYYFRADKEKSIYANIVLDLKSKLEIARTDINHEVKSRGYRYIDESELGIYCSIDDVYGEVLRVSGVKTDIMSEPRNWNKTFRDN